MGPRRCVRRQFTGLQRIAALADGGVAAWDQVQNRFTTLAPDGDLRSVASPASPGLSGREAAFVGAFPDGRYILRFRRSERLLRGSSGGLRADTVPFLLYTPMGALVDTLAAAPSPARFLFDRGVVWGTEDLIFGRSLVSAVGPDRLVVAWDDLSVLEAYGPGGQRSSLSGDFLAPRSVSSARIEAERARRVDALANSTLRVRDSRGVDLTEGIVRERRRIIEDLDAHSSTPAFDLLVVGAEGALGVRRFPFPEEESASWIVLRPDGTPQGRLTLAKEERLLAAKAGWLVVLSQDGWGSPVVRGVHTSALP